MFTENANKTAGQLENTTIHWMQRFNFFKPGLVQDWTALCAVTAARDDDDVINFPETFPALQKQIFTTADML